MHIRYTTLETWNLILQKFDCVRDQLRFAPFAIIRDSPETLGHEHRVTGVFTTMRAAENVIHGVVTVFHARLVEHAFSFDRIQGSITTNRTKQVSHDSTSNLPCIGAFICNESVE